MAAGYCHNLGLKADGSIVAWGYNSHGQCSIPEPNSGFVAIAAGGNHSLAIRSDSDGDAIPDVLDNCPQNANNEQMDLDNDGLGDACDNCPSTANPDPQG